ncbi:hypothetical protein RJ641_026303 [Dillenia turbinata]|uniref:Reverse transcriptase domain-containing protein n=1 Tax=Dillenia turbinata TaxID=194707 RepID=A0AAN8WAT7_9MAGN
MPATSTPLSSIWCRSVFRSKASLQIFSTTNSVLGIAVFRFPHREMKVCNFLIWRSCWCGKAYSHQIYAVRYMDEILVITSGSKLLTMDLKNWVIKFLEENLGLRVDRLKTAIHSAVS